MRKGTKAQLVIFAGAIVLIMAAVIAGSNRVVKPAQDAHWNVYVPKKCQDLAQRLTHGHREAQWDAGNFRALKEQLEGCGARFEEVKN